MAKLATPLTAVVPGQPVNGDTYGDRRCTDPPEESCSDAGCPLHGDSCPDCGRWDCTGEECYWPDEAGLR